MRRLIGALLFAGVCIALATSVRAESIKLAQLDTQQRVTLAVLYDEFKESLPAKIAFCESSLRHTDQYGNVVRGKVDPRDTGLFQFNSRWHQEAAAKLGYDLEEKDHQLAYFEYVHSREGTTPWDASKPCWTSLRLPDPQAVSGYRSQYDSDLSS